MNDPHVEEQFDGTVSVGKPPVQKHRENADQADGPDALQIAPQWAEMLYYQQKEILAHLREEE